jgi:hypothetical protein
MAFVESTIIKDATTGTPAEVTSDNALKVDAGAESALIEVLNALVSEMHRVGDKVNYPAYMTPTGDVRMTIGYIPSGTTMPISGSITNLTSMGVATVDQSFTVFNQNRLTYIQFISQHITRS